MVASMRTHTLNAPFRTPVAKKQDGLTEALRGSLGAGAPSLDFAFGAGVHWQAGRRQDCTATKKLRRLT